VYDGGGDVAVVPEFVPALGVDVLPLAVAVAGALTPGETTGDSGEAPLIGTEVGADSRTGLGTFVLAVG
jgi:hypothetical protein